MVSDMRNDQPFDTVTAFVFFLTSMVAVFNVWRAAMRRIGRHSTHRYNRLHRVGTQLRYRDGIWQYGRGAWVA
jgi:hypothetical protein